VRKKGDSKRAPRCQRGKQNRVACIHVVAADNGNLLKRRIEKSAFRSSRSSTNKIASASRSRDKRNDASVRSRTVVGTEIKEEKNNHFRATKFIFLLHFLLYLESARRDESGVERKKMNGEGGT